jgi:hypothetical protein
LLKVIKTAEGGIATRKGPTMNYLKSITTTVLQSTGVTFPFSVGEKIPGLDGQTIWDVREGVKRVRTLPRSRGCLVS